MGLPCLPSMRFTSTATCRDHCGTIWLCGANTSRLGTAMLVTAPFYLYRDAVRCHRRRAGAKRNPPICCINRLRTFMAVEAAGGYGNDHDVIHNHYLVSAFSAEEQLTRGRFKNTKSKSVPGHPDADYTRGLIARLRRRTNQRARGQFLCSPAIIPTKHFRLIMFSGAHTGRIPRSLRGIRRRRRPRRAVSCRFILVHGLDRKSWRRCHADLLFEP